MVNAEIRCHRPQELVSNSGHPEVDENGQCRNLLPPSARACLKQWTSYTLRWIRMVNAEFGCHCPQELVSNSGHPEVDENGQRRNLLPPSARACLKQWTSYTLRWIRMVNAVFGCHCPQGPVSNSGHPEVDKQSQRRTWLPPSARACLKQWTS